jgi:hypothetical protein
VLDLVGLRGRMHYKIRTYSKGMKQRLGIAQALLHDPELIFFDEPTDGVDPVGRREIRDLMSQLKAEGKTIFLNSHLLGEVEQICDRVAILQRGDIIRIGDIASLTRQKGLFRIGLAPGENFPVEAAAAQGYHLTPSGDLYEVALSDGQEIDALVDLIRQKGLRLRHPSRSGRPWKTCSWRRSLPPSRGSIRTGCTRRATATTATAIGAATTATATAIETGTATGTVIGTATATARTTAPAATTAVTATTASPQPESP